MQIVVVGHLSVPKSSIVVFPRRDNSPLSPCPLTTLSLGLIQMLQDWSIRGRSSGRLVAVGSSLSSQLLHLPLLSTNQPDAVFQDRPEELSPLTSRTNSLLITSIRKLCILLLLLDPPRAISGFKATSSPVAWGLSVGSFPNSKAPRHFHQKVDFTNSSLQICFLTLTCSTTLIEMELNDPMSLR